MSETENRTTAILTMMRWLEDYLYLNALAIFERRLQIERLGFEKDAVAFATRASFDDAPKTIQFLREVCTLKFC